MARVRIEWVPIEVYNLGVLGFDHLQLVYQPNEFVGQQQQSTWWVMEGTRDANVGGATLGVLGADGRTTLAQANAVIDGDIPRLPTEAELLAEIGSPQSRGSRALPFLDPFGAWETMADIAQDFEVQRFPYQSFALPGTAQALINSTSVVASLLHYAGLTFSANTPTGMRLSPGGSTLLGTTEDDEMTIGDGFTALFGGRGADTFNGTNDGGTERFFGGAGNDRFNWSGGSNIFHGGQPLTAYASDGNDTVAYEEAGDILIELFSAPVDHLLPTFTVTHASGTDWLLSIEKLAWLEGVDRLYFGEGATILRNGLTFDMGGQAGASEGRGDEVDFTALGGDGLIVLASPGGALFVTSETSGGDGLWFENVEWITGSAGDDLIYLTAGQRGAAGGSGDDVVDARLIDGSAGTVEAGAAALIEGGEGDDTLISGLGMTIARGGAGGDRFIVAAQATFDVAMELVIEDAGADDRLFVPYNFFNGSAGGLEGSELFPVLGALGTFEELSQEDSQLFFEWRLENDIYFNLDESDGVVTFIGTMMYELIDGDLRISLVEGELEEVVEIVDDTGATITRRVIFYDFETATRVTVRDFEEGDLGIQFYDLGDPEFVELPGGGVVPTYPGRDPGTLALTNNGVLTAPLDARPTGPASNPNAGEGLDEPVLVAGTAGNDMLAAVPNVAGLLQGQGGDDDLSGGSGDDTLDGGTGADVMAGGAGDDTYVVDSAGDAVTELAGEGRDSVRAGVDFALGAHVEDLTLTDAAALGTGNGLDNVLTGNEADNTLVGGAGDDTLVGAAGDDVLIGGEGRDTYVVAAGEGRDAIRDLATGDEPDTVIVTGIGEEDVRFVRVAGSADDLVLAFTMGGRVTIEGFFLGDGRGIERMRFDDGTVWARTELEARAATAGTLVGAPPQAVGDGGILVRGGGALIPAAALLANDVAGDSGAFSIVGVGGPSTGTVSLEADGSIRLVLPDGTEGEVTFTYTIADTAGALASARARVIAVPADGPVAQADGPFDMGEGGTLTLSAADLIGNDADPFGAGLALTAVTPLSGGSVVLAADGSLRFIAEAGATGLHAFRYEISDGQGFTSVGDVTVLINPVTVIEGDAGDNVLNGTTGWDRMFGRAGNDSLDGRGARDALYGGGDDDLLLGGGGGDWLYGGNGADTLSGEAGGDRLAGGRGDDVIEGGAGNDDLIGNAGADQLDGGDGNDELNGGSGVDVLRGGEGGDRLRGGGEDDRLEGGAGDDVLNGGAGTDILLGGEGADRYVVGPGEGADSVLDFDVGPSGEVVDRIDVSAFGLASAEAALLLAAGDGDDVVLTLEPGTTLRLVGVDLASLSAGSFIVS
ncbi:MAG: Ig-like domain-containing protein [Hyphomicrobiaceae bacterium]|nr:Ig-like domain-containing protein [Hyphomicrobiaceae bacterium]